MTATPDPNLPEPFLMADHRALDLLNSRCAPWGDEIEWLGSGPDMVAWLVAAGLAPETAAARLCDGAPDRLDGLAARLRELREWFRGIVAGLADGPVAEGALDPLNQVLAGDRGQRRILADGAGLRLAVTRDWTDPQDLLLPVAEAMADLLCHGDVALVRQCQGPGCTLWFLDTTRNHRRRWCTMSVCGNRAKAAAYRARKAGGDTGAAAGGDTVATADGETAGGDAKATPGLGGVTRPGAGG